MKNNSFLWICSKCEPCSVCYEAIGDEYLKCSQCKQYFHDLCGRIKGSNYDSENLKNKEYFYC